MQKEFNYLRLQKALDYRCMSMIELSKKTQISRQTLADYKNHKSIPTDKEKIRAIAKVLDFPVQFFFEGHDVNESGPAFFRSLLTTKKNYRRAQKCKLEIMGELYDFLKEYIEFPKTDIPKFLDSSPEEAAYKLRKYWGLGEEPILDMVPLVEQHGILVTCVDTETDAIDAFSTSWNDGETEVRYLIGYSKNKRAAARIHFDIAHELGHICLHGLSSEEDLDKEQFKEQEKEANLFASVFLLPESSFKRDALATPTTIRGYTKLKEKWHVSIFAMLIRAYNIGVISNTQYKDMIIKMQKQGIRKQEPLDLELITREPSLLKTAVHLLLSNDVFTKKEFMNALSSEGNLSLYPDQVEFILGLEPGTLQESKIINFADLQLKKHGL